jgi:7,8-dihydropterin-6-yl-methyl-4-(beta-D-ribofuranosyl)aminobenzene 5'-phosphate synthase
MARCWLPARSSALPISRGGFSLNYARYNGGWEPDPWIWDDQAVVVKLKGRGLVVLSGCSHAGAINVLRQARRLTGEDRVYAFVGDMHLTGGSSSV